mgnify:CR=1 FL=1
MDPSNVGRTVARISSTLIDLHLLHHLTGGIVSSYYGVPRLTLDVDFSIQLPSGHRDLPAIGDALIGAFTIDIESARATLKSHGMFQALDNETFIKVDFHAKQLVPGEMERSVVSEVFPGVIIPIASLEDCILSKLIWWSMGSEKSWNDVVQVIKRRNDFSRTLLQSLADQLDLSAELQRLLDES